MKRSRGGLTFLGFVALADMIFAVSAGLLLLNPVRLDEVALGKPDDVPGGDEMKAMIVDLETRIEFLERAAKNARAAVIQVAEELK